MAAELEDGVGADKESAVPIVSVNLRDAGSEAMRVAQQCTNSLSSAIGDVMSRCPGLTSPLYLDALLTLEDCLRRLEDWQDAFRSAFANVSDQEVVAEDYGASLVAKMQERLVLLGSMLGDFQVTAVGDNAAHADATGLRNAVEQIHDVIDCLMSYRTALILYRDSSSGGLQGAFPQVPLQSEAVPPEAQGKDSKTDFHGQGDEVATLRPSALQLGSSRPSGEPSYVATSKQTNTTAQPQQSSENQKNLKPKPYYACRGFYRSKSEKELSLHCPSLFRVIAKRANGWWYVVGVDGKPGWASGDFLDPIDDLADFLKSSWPGREVRLPQEVSKKPSILARSPSGTPPRRFRLDTAAGGPAASLKDTTDFPPGHTSWLFTPEEVCLVSQNDRIRLKLVIVGDRACGKTCAVDTFSKGRFPDVSVPTVVHNSHADIEVDGHMVELSFWDTSGQDHDRLRQLSYPGCHVVVISYAIDSPDSLENVCSKWISEKDWFTWHVPPVLVGLKEDLRRDPNTIAHLARTRQAPVTYQQGLAAAKYIGAAAYVECSAKTGGGIRSTFEMATKVGLHARDWSRQNFPRRRVKSGCISC